MDKETAWLKKRLGKITASKLSNIMSASGKIIDENISFIRKVRFERNHGFSLPVSSYAMEQGKIREPYAVEWYRANYPDQKIIYSQELPALPFWENPDVPNFGASPDCFTEDETLVVEIKNVISNGQIEFFFDPMTSYEEKKMAVMKEHLDQICGQFISNMKVQTVRLLKYCAQDDNIMEDTTSPIDPWRGIVFDFNRKDYEESIFAAIDRIILFNAFISAPVNPSEFKKGEWFIDEEGKLRRK